MKKIIVVMAASLLAGVSVEAFSGPIDIPSVPIWTDEPHIGLPSPIFVPTPWEESTNSVLSVTSPSRLMAYVELTKGGSLPPGLYPLFNGQCISNVMPVVDSDANHYYESVLKISFNPQNKCPQQVCFALDYDRNPSDWTFNVGDSINNNGWGGGAGSDSNSVAELQILNQEFATYSSAVAPPGGVVDVLAREKLQLSEGSFKACVANQFAKWGNPSGTLATGNSKLLFRLPDNAPAYGGNPAGNGNYDIYVGFNRVIAAGGATTRKGGGLARVMITTGN
jgi:hypothetical protein